MLARDGISWGAISWCRPWRLMKATGIGAPLVGDGWCRMEIGDDGAPQGVVGFRVATWVKWGRDWRPVPPMTAMWTGSGSLSVSSVRPEGDVGMWRVRGVCD